MQSLRVSRMALCGLSAPDVENIPNSTVCTMTAENAAHAARHLQRAAHGTNAGCGNSPISSSAFASTSRLRGQARSRDTGNPRSISFIRKSDRRSPMNNGAYKGFGSQALSRQPTAHSRAHSADVVAKGQDAADGSAAMRRSSACTSRRMGTSASIRSPMSRSSGTECIPLPSYAALQRIRTRSTTVLSAMGRFTDFPIERMTDTCATAGNNSGHGHKSASIDTTAYARRISGSTSKKSNGSTTIARWPPSIRLSPSFPSFRKSFCIHILDLLHNKKSSFPLPYPSL